MAFYSEQSVQEVFDSNLDKAKECLGRLEFCCSGRPSFGGLTGWVFEETIRQCLQRELELLGLPSIFEPQQRLGGRSKVDFVVSRQVAIEIKEKGLFDRTASDRYAKRAKEAASKGYSYLYLTLGETYSPYRDAMVKAVGPENAFFLDKLGDWARFIRRVGDELRKLSQA